MKDLSPVIFRGERDGSLRAPLGYSNPYFFAESYAQAKRYAGRGTEPVECVIQGASLLDVMELKALNPDHISLIEKLTAEFDDWTCRYSGEPRDAWSFIDGGDLYDYECTGSGERWKALFQIGLDDFDVVRIKDCTDGTDKVAVPVWVTAKPECIRLATLGEQLASRLSRQPWGETQAWLERNHGDLLQRINRLTVVDDEYRLDQVGEMIPPENFQKMGYQGGHTAVWRAMPAGADIRPGDWVSLTKSYAAQHARHIDGKDFEVKALERVLASDIYWAGTDEREFFFMPEAWRKPGLSAQEYLQCLTSDQVRILCDGEESLITRHREAIAGVKAHVLNTFDHDACGIFHGPEHWARVSQHGQAVARAAGVDPLITHVFAWVHDSQREDEGYDAEHGPRAALFINENRKPLFGFLRDDQVKDLAHACDQHSNGVTEGQPWVQACWDADRLDLWRVGFEPNPKYLCTAYAKQPGVIRDALAFCKEDGQDAQEDAVSSRDRRRSFVRETM